MGIPSIIPASPGVKNAHRRKTRHYRANWMSGNKTKLKNFNFKNRKK